MRVFFEELVLLLCIFKFWVARSNEVLQMLQVRDRPLVYAKGDECVSKVFPDVPSSGGARLTNRRGRATPQKKKTFDCTIGFQGEDPASNLLRNLHFTLS